MSAISLPAPAIGPVPAAAAEPAPSPAPPAPPAKRLGVKIPLISTRIAGKIIAPYLVLILVLALLAVYVVTNLVQNTINNKLNEKLQDGGHATNEAMVKLETEYLQSLRLMTNTEGVAEALSAQDLSKLEELLLPLQVNAKMDLVDVIARDGSMLMALRSDELRDRAAQITDGKLGHQLIAQNVLNGVIDTLGDKYTSLVTTSWGPAIYAASPVKLEDQVVGAILIGTTLERGLGKLSKEAQVSLVVYDNNGKLLATTLPAQDLLGVTAEEAAAAAASGTVPVGTGGITLELSKEIAAQATGSQPVLVRRALQMRARLQCSRLSS